MRIPMLGPSLTTFGLTVGTVMPLPNNGNWPPGPVSRRRLRFFRATLICLSYRGNGGADRTRAGLLRVDNALIRLLHLQPQVLVVGDGSNALLVVFPDLF